MQKVRRVIWPTGDEIARVKVFVIFVASAALERKHERVGGQDEVRKHTMMKNLSAARPTRVLAMLPTTAVTLIGPDEDEEVPVEEEAAVEAGPMLLVTGAKVEYEPLGVAQKESETDTSE